MDEKTPRFEIILCACAGDEQADRLARDLVERRLAACVQAMPIRSTYAWKGKIERENEILLIIKTRAARYPEIEEYIRRNHSYELPEIVRLPIAGGFAPYLDWVAAAVADAE